MKTSSLLVFLLLFSSFLTAQIPADTIRIRQLINEISTAFQSRQYETAIQLADSALGLCAKSRQPVLQYEAIIQHSKGISLMRKGDYPEALLPLQRGLELRKQYYGSSHHELISSYSALGAYHNDMGAFDTALQYFEPALKIAANNRFLSQASYARLLTNYALCQEGLGDLRGAETTNWEVVKIRKVIDENNPDLLSSYQNLGALNISQGHYGEARDLTEKALTLIRQSTQDTLVEDLADIWQNFGVIAFETGDNSEARYYFEKALRVNQAAHGTDYYKNGMNYHALGNLEMTVGNLAQADALQQNAIAIWNANGLPSDHPYAVVSLESLSAIAEKRQQWERADSLIGIVNHALKNVYGNRYPSLVRSANRSTRLSILRGNTEQAWTRSREALIAAGMSPDAPDWSQADISIDLIDALNNAGRVATMRFRQTGATIWSDRAGDFFNAAGTLWEKLTRETYNEDSEKFFVREARSAVEDILVFLLKDRAGRPASTAEAFAWSDRVHAALLHKTLRRSGALQFGGVSDSLQAGVASLQAQLNYLEKQKAELRALPPETAEIALKDMEGRRFELNAQLLALMATIEQTCPEYNSRKDLSTPGLKDIRQRLRPDQCLLEYFVGDSTLVIFVLRHDTLIAWMTPLNIPIENLVKKLLYGLTAFNLQSPGNQPDDLYLQSSDTYAEAAFALYRELIAPVEKWLTPAVVIAPDGPLNFIPFEVLLTQKPERSDRFKSHQYLLLKYKIAYIYSAGLLYAMTEREGMVTPGRSLLALAPYAQSDGSKKYGNLPPLPASKREALYAKQLWGGDALIGPVFSKDSALKLLPAYRIIHWSSHAIANSKLEDLSYIAMPDGNHIYVRDLYNLRLNTDLIILSACETGAGFLVTGEGVISLARACAYAGAHSIVTSLWKVNDLKTQQLMEIFHNNLYSGVRIDEALQQTKLTWITSAENSSLAHPFFWAGFIAIGDMKAVK